MSSRGSAGGGTRRYAATVEKGENAWKREWSSFISGVDLKQVRDGTRGIALKASRDLEQEAYAAHKAVDEDDGDEVAPTTYSYLFSSPAQRKADREVKLKQQREAERRHRLEKEKEKKQKMKEKRQRQRAAAAAGGEVLEEEEDDDDDDERSKHQKALVEAAKRGLQLEGMTRKEKRSFLHLTVTEEQQQAEQHAKEFKLHELMDERIAWYQQGPHPIDLIAEKLVRKKAEKRGKQMGLTHYNYLLPHPSWMAKRMQRRREAVMVGMGRHFVYDDDGQAWEPLRGIPVDLTKVNVLLSQPLFKAEAGAEETTAASASPEAEHADEEEAPSADPATEPEEGPCKTTRSEKRVSGSTAKAAPPRFDVLDPQKMQTSYVRRVLQDPQAALALQQANLSTTFLSPGLVHKPNIGLTDDAQA
ncbi:hypothetical protein STCU_05784 [Strigomonas culicis]|uniref:Uncharacterized protein n=1 Tax=Strigomonas culicis TaxID=28005 RepID=S9U9C3_9TRYP|nr:hypothetical protein STCU_05784 [Strigomonas culicis]|eukprot:EPY27372.1 hypothetical protein STCU_05784 [Strigomonas culicis]